MARCSTQLGGSAMVGKKRSDEQRGVQCFSTLDRNIQGSDREDVAQSAATVPVTDYFLGRAVPRAKNCKRPLDQILYLDSGWQVFLLASAWIL